MVQLTQWIVGIASALSTFVNPQNEVYWDTQMDQAVVRGKIDSSRGVINYYGIPYGEAPIGDRRWRAPEKRTITGLFDASSPAPGCFIETAYWSLPEPDIPQSEDCLTLDIQTPTNPPNASLPVLVNIHGGGYLAGSSNDLRGTHLINQASGNLIYISINYRLGLLGFLGGSDVESNGSLNGGLLDQRLALEWVQQNIHHFGGDPKKVTLYGESAGGGSVSYQVTAYGGSGETPFVGAYSACTWWTPVWSKESQEFAYQKVLQISNCTDISCLRQLDETAIQKLSKDSQQALHDQPQNGYGLFMFSPVVDGSFVKMAPSQSYQTGNFHKVPLIVDHSPYEGLMFTSLELLDSNEFLAYNKTLQDFDQKYPAASLELTKTFFNDIYNIQDYSNVFEHRNSWFSDILINCPTQMIAQYASEAGVPVYKMLFSTGTQLHGAPSPFYFSPEVDTTVLNQELSKDLSSYLISFVQTGNPNTFKRTTALEWKTYAEGQNILQVQTRNSVIKKDEDVNKRCAFISQNAHIFST